MSEYRIPPPHVQFSPPIHDSDVRNIGRQYGDNWTKCFCALYGNCVEETENGTSITRKAHIVYNDQHRVVAKHEYRNMADDWEEYAYKAEVVGIDLRGTTSVAVPLAGYPCSAAEVHRKIFDAIATFVRSSPNPIDLEQTLYQVMVDTVTPADTMGYKIKISNVTFANTPPAGSELTPAERICQLTGLINNRQDNLAVMFRQEVLSPILRNGANETEWNRLLSDEYPVDDSICNGGEIVYKR